MHEKPVTGLNSLCAPSSLSRLLWLGLFPSASSLDSRRFSCTCRFSPIFLLQPVGPYTVLPHHLPRLLCPPRSARLHGTSRTQRSGWLLPVHPQGGFNCGGFTKLSFILEQQREAAFVDLSGKPLQKAFVRGRRIAKNLIIRLNSRHGPALGRMLSKQPPQRPRAGIVGLQEMLWQGWRAQQGL